MPEWAGLRWFRKGQFNHVAMEWDAEAVRVYVNGVLVNYETKRPLPFFQTPSGIVLGPAWGGYSWSGAIDELRLSRREAIRAEAAQGRSMAGDSRARRRPPRRSRLRRFASRPPTPPPSGRSCWRPSPRRRRAQSFSPPRCSSPSWTATRRLPSRRTSRCPA